MMRKSLIRLLVISAFSTFLVGVASASLITNGDFSDSGDLAGFTATGSIIYEPTGEFAQLETDGGFIRTLEQTFTVPVSATQFSFDFAFSTEATQASFPDSFAASKITTLDGDFLDIMVVDVFGVLADASDGIENFTGAVPIDVAFDPSVLIAGFTPFAGGTTFSGRISMMLPTEVLGEEVTLFLDLFDQQDSFQSIAAVDNITAQSISTTQPIPEPTSVSLFVVGLLGFAWVARRKRESEK